MTPSEESRVSQSGEGRIRRVTPEEARAMTIVACLEHRSDVATQRGWDLAVEHFGLPVPTSTDGREHR